ncbi:MAG TPA: hypothetical protein VD866_29840, partial [Urbifossiella sp.]|nr:hypothetical protein [Urbifossiella sp.]
MPPPNPPRRRPTDDDDFEVVDEAPPAPRGRPLPPLPGEAAAAPPSAPRPAAKPAPKPAPPVAKPAPKPAPPVAKPAPKPAPKPAFEVVDDTEVEVTAKAKTGQTRKPPRDDEDDDRPRRKKGKKKGDRLKTGEEYADEVRERRLKEFEYIWPTVILLLGMGMAITGAIGAGGAAGALSVALVIGGLFVSIPLTIATLMVVGAVCGINYGRFGPGVLKIAAVTFVVNGVYFLCEWFKVPDFVAGPIGCAVAFGMFKTMFDLDNG